jgi:hypothetical protein
MPSTAEIAAFMAKYAERMNDGVRSGVVDSAFLEGCFAPDLIGASPSGVMAGKNQGLAETLAKGTDAYRQMGGTAFVAERIDAEELAPNSFMATVGWRFDYRRPKDHTVGSISFTNRYFVTTATGKPKIFAWITPDEQAALREHGLV